MRHDFWFSIIGINEFTTQFPKIDSLLGKTIIHENLFICSNYSHIPYAQT